MAVRILLPGNPRVLIDEEDLAKVAEFRWYVARGEWHDYVRAHQGGRMVYLHRLIMDAPPDRVVDHINRDGLDNRKANLRLCTTAENGWNRGKTKRNKSGYKGVHWFKRDGVWQAQYQIHGRQVHVGYFATPEAAYEARTAAIRQAHGAFARAE